MTLRHRNYPWLPVFDAECSGLEWPLLRYVFLALVGAFLPAAHPAAQDFIEVNYADPVVSVPRQIFVVCIEKDKVPPVYAKIEYAPGQNPSGYGGRDWTPKSSISPFNRSNQIGDAGALALAVAPKCLAEFEQTWWDAGNKLDQLTFREVIVPADDGDEHSAATGPPSENALEKYRKEAKSVHEKCETGHPLYLRYYNCRCLESRFLDARVERGPEIHRQNILNDIRAQCPDRAKTAETE